MTLKEIILELEKRLNVFFSVFVFHEKTRSLGKGYVPNTFYKRVEVNSYLANYDYQNDAGFWAKSSEYILIGKPGRIEIVPIHTGLSMTRRSGAMDVFEFLKNDWV